jgi:carboxypeptidase PM20D1
MMTQAAHRSRTTSTGTKRKVLRGLFLGALLLIGFVLVRTVASSPAPTAAPPAALVAIAETAAERLAGAVRVPTIAHEDPAAFDREAFRDLHAYLNRAFPRVHRALRTETVGEHSLLYTWPGKNASAEPILPMGHLDVVPIEPGTEKQWQQPPFSGRIVDGFIWGRGAIDNKSAVLGILEAVEMLLAEGFTPNRTLYLAFGHDEEVGGTHGARQIAELLKSRGVRLAMVLDEGGVIGDGLLPGVSLPVAMVGIAEKGFATIDLTTKTSGGHSSLPPKQSAVGILSAAIARLEKHQMPARLEAPTRQMLERVAPEFGFANRVVFANLWLTKPLVVRQLEATATTNAMVRTTTAATIFQAGTKDNVLPTQARAAINFRILPGDSVAAVVEHVRRVVNDPRVEVRGGGRFIAEPSAVSSTKSEEFRLLERTIRSTTPGAIVAPYQVVVVTDARYFAALSSNIFRFLPLRLTPVDTARMHGANERVRVKDYEAAIRFYRQLLVNANDHADRQYAALDPQ